LIRLGTSPLVSAAAPRSIAAAPALD
jgi:hypothetical protein